MLSGTRIRLCTEQDLPRVAALFARWEAEGSVHGLRAETPEQLRPRMGGFFLVAEAGAEIVGFVIAQAKAEPACVLPAGRPHLEIQDLYVVSAHRRLGIGGRLLGAVMDAAAKAGLSGFTLYSASRDWQAAFRFYERFGFRMWAFQMYKDGLCDSAT